jgi:RNA polymerase, sigma subunit, SigV
MKTKTNRDYVTKFIIENREGYYRLAYTYVKNQQDALDIVQEAICKALESQHKLKNPDGIKSWFYKIVVHTALDFL